MGRDKGSRGKMPLSGLQKKLVAQGNTAAEAYPNLDRILRVDIVE